MDSYHDYYDKIASRFDSLRLDREQEIEMAGEAVLKCLSATADVLDVGCGTGRYGSWLARRGFSVTGLDSSGAQLQHAHGLEVMVEGDAADMPFPDEQFDACLVVMMLHQLGVEGRQSALRECFRVLRPGGVMLIKTCSEADLRRRPLARWFPSALEVNLRRYPSLEELTSGLQSTGFIVDEIKPTHSVQSVATAEYLAAVREQHNTTLAMLPRGEYLAGVQELERDAGGMGETVAHDHWHTLILAKRPEDQ